jgi:hypothetical protein
LPRSQSALVAAWPGSSRSPYLNRLARAILRKSRSPYSSCYRHQ